MIDPADPSDIEDLLAPHGRCNLCRCPFGVVDPVTGFLNYKAFCEGNSICTQCEQDEKLEYSYRYDESQKDRRR